MKVLFLALTATRARSIIHQSDFLLERGHGVALVTTNPDPWREHGLDPRVELHTLREGEGRHLLPRAERVLLFRAPAAVFGRLKRLAGPRAGLVAGVERRYGRLADLVHRLVFLRFYKALRPYLLWRVARRQVLPRLDLAAVDEVVVGDSHAIPLGWHLARSHPELKFGFSLDRSGYETRPGPAHAADV